MDAGRSILVVDDDAYIRDTLSDALGLVGYDVRTAANGKLALDLISLEGAPAVIFLDMMMPEMDGLQFLDATRQQSSLGAIPVVVMTASMYVHSIEGACAIIAKPFDLDTFLRLAETFCKTPVPPYRNLQ